jgi:hypothetical protein
MALFFLGQAFNQPGAITSAGVSMKQLHELWRDTIGAIRNVGRWRGISP